MNTTAKMYTGPQRYDLLNAYKIVDRIRVSGLRYWICRRAVSEGKMEVREMTCVTLLKLLLRGIHIGRHKESGVWFTGTRRWLLYSSDCIYLAIGYLRIRIMKPTFLLESSQERRKRLSRTSCCPSERDES